MNSDEFNEKYQKYLNEGYYGMDFNTQEVIDYMDREFSKEIKENPTFTYQQIKWKFGASRVYSSSNKNSIWEEGINKIMQKCRYESKKS